MFKRKVQAKCNFVPFQSDPPRIGHYRESHPPVLGMLAHLALNLVDSKISLGLE